MTKSKLCVSFSGGRTSAVMTKLCLENYKESHDIQVIFANTGCEHPDTLRFVDACDRNWGFGTIWLEAEVNPEKGRGIKHKRVTYETASRKGEPFEEVIKKYGIFNQVNPSCTARLKTDVIESYLRSMGWVRGKKINYDTAIGIRADEIDRISCKAKENRFVYPMVNAGWTKQMVIDYMKQFDWDLRIPEHLGNCVWCWKKTLRKQLTLAKDHPEVFEFPLKMEEKYGYAHAHRKGKRPQDGKRVFFRQFLSAEDILKKAQTEQFTRFDDPNFDERKHWDETLDRQTGCNESCEVYPTDGT